MKVSDKLITQTISGRNYRVFRQWISIFDRLQETPKDANALNLLQQYNRKWKEPKEYIQLDANEHDVPEYGMLGVLGYSVSFVDPSKQRQNIIPERRQALLKHIFANELPPLFDESYRQKWGDPNSQQRLDHILSVLNKLVGNREYRFERFSKNKERWNEDIRAIEVFRKEQFHKL